MHDHNLDDLIIDNIEPKNSKTKSLLTIIALLIVVLIVAIILTKTLLKVPNNSALAFEENITEMIAPELKLKEPARVTQTKKEPSLSNMIESELQNPASQTKESVVVIKKEKTAPALELPTVPQIVETEKELALSDITQSEIEAPVDQSKKQAVSKDEKDAADIAHWASVQKQREAEKEAEESKTQKADKETVKVTERIQPEKAPAPVLKKTVAAKPVPATVSAGKYYVQVGAYRKKPSTRFMSVIRNNRYNYTITQPDANGIKKVLIGPYNDQTSAKRALVSIRDRLSKRAFIVKR